MRCPDCAHDNPDDFAFCGECGAALRAASACPSCGRENPAEQKFCGGCGARLTASATPAAPAPALIPASFEPVSFAGGRYRVSQLLGEGGKNRVYRAHDALLDREVAFALIKTEGLDEAGRERLRREAQAMGRLGEHPHIVAVYDLGEERGQPYLVSQYMAGGDVERLIAAAPDHRLPLTQTLAIAQAVCRALAFAHERGIVHRDLKPGNVWLTADGTAKLGDFGLAVALDRSRITQAGMMVGTVSYLPPEQALGGEVTARSDLYSLGAMLYELVTGRPPFVADDPTAVISQHLNTPPVAPSYLSEHCPPDLEELILRLLAKRPDQRPASAADALAALERVDPTQRSARHSGSQENPLDRLARGVFVGREQELSRLRSAFDEAFAGRGSVVMLVGEPGIGKTRTAQELETYARLRGAQVLWGRAHEAAGAPAYWPWLQVGRAYGSSNDLTQIQPAMAGTGGELARLFPELQPAGAPPLPEPLADPEAAQFRLFDAYATFIRAASDGVRATHASPLLIVLDDLHWADKPSLLLLQHLARELSGMRVLIVGTFRDTELARTHPLSEALAALNRESGFQRVALRGLSQSEVAGYIQAAANAATRPEVVARIYEETEGNPFFLAEVVNLLTQEGTLARDSLSDIRVPDGVREALGRRLDRISPETNELLQVAAVAGREFTYDALTLLGEHDEVELLRCIEEGINARVIEEMDRPGRYRFTHALMQETLLSELSTTRRVRLHGQVGEALERRRGARADERAARLAQHFGEAALLSPRHAAKAVRYATLAAQQAEGQFAWEEAARLYEQVLTLLSEAEDDLGEDAAALLVAQGRCYRYAAEFRAAWDSLTSAVARYRARGDGLGLARAAAELNTNMAPPERVIPLVEEALAALEDGEPHLRARLLLQRAGSAWDDAAQRAVAQAAELARSHGYPDIAARVSSLEANRAFRELRLAEADAAYRAAYEACVRAGLLEGARGALSGRANLLIMEGRLDEGGAAVTEVLAHARKYHLRAGEVLGLSKLAAIALGRCEFARFAALVAEQPGIFSMPMMEAARAELAGEHRQALALAPSAEVYADAYRQAYRAGSLARICCSGGDVAGARQHLAAWQAWYDQLATSATNARFDAVAAIDTCLATLGEEARVRAVYAESVGWAPWRCDFLPAWGFDHIRGALALRLGLLEEAAGHYRTGLAWAERERYPVEQGRCLAGLAEVAAQRGEQGEALALLDRAAGLFQEHGAVPYLRQVVATKLALQSVATGPRTTSIDAVTTAVQEQPPDLRSHAAPDGTVTVMFTDIEDSTGLTERLGDARWQALLREHNALIRQQLRAHSGYEVKTLGDGFMVAFASARRALQCAIAIQRAASDYAEHHPDTPLRVRIGLHTGEAVREAGDFFGRHVILASRIAAQAEGGEILVSTLLKELTESAGEFRFGEERQVALKGLAGTQQVVAVEWV